MKRGDPGPRRTAGWRRFCPVADAPHAVMGRVRRQSNFLRIAPRFFHPIKDRSMGRRLSKIACPATPPDGRPRRIGSAPRSRADSNGDRKSFETGLKSGRVRGDGRISIFRSGAP
ncbi:hypothetical protein [Burkholderia stagnalis]|uniref:hypothetical protein n=1 Tax=Burkholderia stagnalis TaxID=1503054 RepID=UPI0012D9ABC9|nr:hypothetical protein [Burkholderia stagnalis]